MEFVKGLFSSLNFSYIYSREGHPVYAARVTLLSPKEKRYVFCVSSGPPQQGEVHISMLNVLSIQTRTLTVDYKLKEQFFFFENKEKIPLELFEEDDNYAKFRGAIPLVVTLIKKKKSKFPPKVGLIAALNTFSCIVVPV